jgi:hypothetical protein
MGCSAVGAFARFRQRNRATIRSDTIWVRYGRTTIRSSPPGSDATDSTWKRAVCLLQSSKQRSTSSTTGCPRCSPDLNGSRTACRFAIRLPAIPRLGLAGAVPYLIQAVLGLTREAFERRLWIRHPVLPEFVHWLELHRLRVGRAHADLRFERTANGTVHAVVVNLDGNLDVVIEDDTENVRKKWDL